MVLCFLAGSVGFVISQTGVMVNHPMTRTFHSFLHLVGSGGGLLLLLGLALYALTYSRRIKLFGLLGAGIVGIGLLFFILGNFNYAILHGLLNLVTINDPVHQIPLSLAPLLLSLGAFIFGLAATRNKTLSIYLAFFFLVSSLIYGLGWLQVGDSMQRQTNLSRYVKALLIILPFGAAWFWLGVEQLRSKKSFQNS